MEYQFRSVSANLYKNRARDDLVMFYFRDGANYASVYTQSKIISENIKWNLNQRVKKIFSLTNKHKKCKLFYWRQQGYKSLERIAELTSLQLTDKKTKTR